jgi:hypothetical protein
MRSHKTGLVLSIFGVLVVSVVSGYFGATIKHFGEPSYQGRPVSYWAEQLSQMNASQLTATEAIQAIGPKGIAYPRLLHGQRREISVPRTLKRGRMKSFNSVS